MVDGYSGLTGRRPHLRTTESAVLSRREVDGVFGSGQNDLVELVIVSD